VYFHIFPANLVSWGLATAVFWLVLISLGLVGCEFDFLGNGSLLKSIFKTYFQKVFSKYYFILYFQNTFKKYFILFSKYFSKVFCPTLYRT